MRLDDNRGLVRAWEVGHREQSFAFDLQKGARVLVY